MKPLTAYLLVLSTTTAGVIIVGSWCASHSQGAAVVVGIPALSDTGGTPTNPRVDGSHGVRRALEPRAWELTESVPGLALSQSRLTGRPLAAPTRDGGPVAASMVGPQIVRAQGVRPEREAGGYLMAVPSPGLLDLASASARLCGVPEPILFALISRESSWRQTHDGRTLRSISGALGLTQIKASTAREVSPTLDPHEPFGNLLAGACYLRRQFDRFGDWGIALKAYRVGPNSPALHSKTASDYSDEIMERDSN